ncbi:MAG: methyltransferase [Candidatus Aminicenantes bacterium]|nr:methyltransferase [Candidatus Aminicenantes bacterium]
MSPSPARKDETLDAFYRGRVLVLQKKKGYRFSVDAPLLADFVETRPGETLLELGAGCGIIGLLLAAVKPFRRLVALEIQPALADLARRNVALNRFEERIAVVEADLRAFGPAERFDVVFSNPPYIKRRGGHLSLNRERTLARHEVACDIGDVLAKTAECLAPGGRAYFVYPVRRANDFRRASERSGLALRRLRPVRPRAEAPANLFLAACAAAGEDGGGAAEEAAPLVLFGPDGAYTAEADAIFSGRDHA